MIKRRNRRSETTSPDRTQPPTRSADDARSKPRKSEDSAQAPSKSGGKRDWFLAAALLVVLVLIYQPAWQGGFLWDDDLHLLDNPVLQPGGLATVWMPGRYINYWPLTFTVYCLEHKLWGLNTLGFHLVNIAVHGISALLVWRILVELRVPGALFAAAIFALHPVNVESVAWIAQLKGLLSLMFGLLSMYFFLAWEKGNKWGAALSIAAFLLSTLSKGMVITLPVVLLACAWWQRERIARQDLLRVAPFLLIGAAMMAIEIWGQHLVAADGDVRSDSLFSRAVVAGCAVWFYFWKVIWPVDLCFVYPRWRIDNHQVLAYLPGVLLIALFALAWWKRRTWGRTAVVLMVGYVALLLPALGFVSIYYMRYSFVADHWQYAAMVVPCVVFAGMAATLLRRPYFSLRKPYYLFCAAVLAALSILTWRQSHIYANVDSLYLATIDQNPECWLAYNNLGRLEDERGNKDKARAFYEQALRYNPDYAEAHNNLGIILAQSGHRDEAMGHYRQALKILPSYADAHNNLGNALGKCGQIDEAIFHYQQALKSSPDHAEAHFNLAGVLEQKGRFREAAVHLNSALRLLPDHPMVLQWGAWMLATCPDSTVRNGAEATRLALRAVQITKGADPVMLDTLAAACAEAGRFDQAVGAAQRALQLATARGDTTLADAVRGRIKLYESGTAFRDRRIIP